MDKKTVRNKNRKPGMRTGLIFCLLFALMLTGCNSPAVNVPAVTDGTDPAAQTEATETETPETEAPGLPVPDPSARVEETASGQDAGKVNVTKESLEAFLSCMVGSGEEPPYNHLRGLTLHGETDRDAGIFWSVILMLLAGNRYEKPNDVYFFSLSDVQQYAKMYYNADDFRYSDFTGVAMRFNEAESRYESMLCFGINDEGSSLYGEPVVERFEIAGGRISAVCSVEERNVENGTVTKELYRITLACENGSYVILSVQQA